MPYFSYSAIVGALYRDQRARKANAARAQVRTLVRPRRVAAQRGAELRALRRRRLFRRAARCKRHHTQVLDTDFILHFKTALYSS